MLANKSHENVQISHNDRASQTRREKKVFRKSQYEGPPDTLKNGATSKHAVEFTSIPDQLKHQSRWVVSKNKRPFMAEAANGLADVSDPDTWSSFATTQTAYEEGGYDGIGFVFNGDGIVGIDLDDCVINGQPSESALEILREIGCSYVEISQSGRGLHAYGFYDGPTLAGKRGSYKGVKTEVYCTRRYFVVTGNVWQQGNLPMLRGLKAVYDQINRQHAPALAEETKAIASVSSVASVASVSSVRFPPTCIPTDEGQRHDCIFELARHLKAKMPGASYEELNAVLQQWWVHAEPNVRTKDFNLSMIGFHLAWDRVKFPKGELLAKVLSDLPDDPPENLGGFLGLHGRRLYHLCQLLDRHQREHFKNDVFMLGCRTAGEALSIDFRTANSALNAFVHKGLIELVEKGGHRKVSRYRLCKPAGH